jgi:hypothetical protein
VREVYVQRFLGPSAEGLRAGIPEREGMPLESDAAYHCPSCFEQNYVAVDPSGGRRQRFVEDCPVCCRPIAFEVGFDAEGEPVVFSAEAE